MASSFKNKKAFISSPKNELIMTKKITLLLMLTLFSMLVFPQPGIMFTFTGAHDTSYIQIDSLVIVNQTQNCDTVLVWPDTVLHFTYVGIPKFENPGNNIQVFQNHPNPFENETSISVSVPDEGEVIIMISDITGRSLISQRHFLERGMHSFLFTAGNSGMYVFSALSINKRSSIKLLSNSRVTGNKLSLIHTGKEQSSSTLKSTNILNDFIFSPGDRLVVKGFYDQIESPLIDNPSHSKDYSLQFAYNIPCPGMPQIEYHGQFYNTVQIFNQCWLAENLNYETGNSWCYDNDSENCSVFGRLYDWGTALNVCPDGWLLPNDTDWNILEGSADKVYSINDPEWDNLGWRGIDVGSHLKSIEGWNDTVNNTDRFGFGALPAGRSGGSTTFYHLGSASFWWTTSEHSQLYYAFRRHLADGYDQSSRHGTLKSFGLSVRCIKDETNDPPNAAFTASNSTGIPPLEVTFTDQSSQNTTNWYWDFGDGNSSNLQNPMHTYEDYGSYTIKLFASNNYGIDSITKINLINVTTGIGNGTPCPGTPTVTDIDGNVYSTVLIGDQCWMAENLNTTRDAQGNNITRYCYQNVHFNCDWYGGLYNWATVMNGEESSNNVPSGVQGICPDGWHLPSDAEWTQLIEYINAQGYPNSDVSNGAGNTLKSCRQEYSPLGGECETSEHPRWKSHYTHIGFNEFGFSAMPGGIRSNTGTYGYIGFFGKYWTSTVDSSLHAWSRLMGYDNGRVLRNNNYRSYAYSVRCVMD